MAYSLPFMYLWNAVQSALPLAKQQTLCSGHREDDVRLQSQSDCSNHNGERTEVICSVLLGPV